MRRHGASETQKKADANGRGLLLAVDFLRLGGHLADTLWITFTVPRTVMVTLVVTTMFLAPDMMIWYRAHHLPIYLPLRVPIYVKIALDPVPALLIFHLLQNQSQNHVHVAPRVPKACPFPRVPPRFHLAPLRPPICLPKWTNTSKIATTLDWILLP